MFFSSRISQRVYLKLNSAITEPTIKSTHCTVFCLYFSQLLHILVSIFLCKAPPAPGSVRVTPLPQHGVLRVTWRVPTVDTGLTITAYSVQYRTSSNGPYSRARTVSGRFTSTTISGLQLGTGYRVRVAAVTQLGNGVYSRDVVGTTYKRE